MIYLVYFKVFPCINFLAGNVPLWQPCRWKVAAILHALGPANICYKPVLQIRFTSFHGLSLTCRSCTALRPWIGIPSVHITVITVITVPKQKEQNKALFHSFSHSLSSHLFSLELQLKHSCQASSRQPSPVFVKSCIKDMTMQLCTRSIRNCMSASEKKVWICFATATLVVLYTVLAMHKVFVGNCHPNQSYPKCGFDALRSQWPCSTRIWEGMVIGHGELF